LDSDASKEVMPAHSHSAFSPSNPHILRSIE
jgi:hypothetical protein